MFDWFRSRCPLDDGARRWTEDRVGWLLGQFGLDRLKAATIVLPTKQFFPDHYDQSEQAARTLFERTCSYMGVDPKGVELTFYQPTHRPGFARSLVRSRLPWAGQFRLGPEVNSIRVDVTLLTLPDTLIATFAHELSHQLLMGSKLIDPNDDDDELVTDLTAGFFGFGVINSNQLLANRFRLNRRGDEVGGLGYLTPRIWGYGLALLAWLRDDSQPTWASWLRPAIRKPFRRSLTFLERSRPEIVAGGRLGATDRMPLLSVEYCNSMPPDDSSKSADPYDDEPDVEAEVSATIEIDLGDSAQADVEGAGLAELLFEASQYIEAGVWDKAVDLLNAAIARDPENETAYQQRALVLLELGQLEAAVADGEAAVRLEPDEAEAYLARGAAYVKVQRFDEAVADLTRYINDEDYLSARGYRASKGYYLRGLAYAGLREFKKAIKDFDRAIRKWPDWPEPYEARAAANESLGNAKLASADRDEAQRRATP